MTDELERRAGFDSLEQLRAYLGAQRARFEKLKPTLTKARRGQLWRVLNELEREASAWEADLAPKARAKSRPRAIAILANPRELERPRRLAKTRTPTAKKTMPVLELRHGRVGSHAITYELRHVLCGKKHCRKWHGPYWYAYWKAGGRVRTAYVGKEFAPLIINSTGFLVKKPKRFDEGK